jgi:hypothetical protein
VAEKVSPKSHQNYAACRVILFPKYLGKPSEAFRAEKTAQSLKLDVLGYSQAIVRQAAPMSDLLVQRQQAVSYFE